MKRLAVLLASIIAICAALAWGYVYLQKKRGEPLHYPLIYINEIMPVNNGVILDEDGKSNDWIELLNPGTESVSLGGWYLSDKKTDLGRWMFPEGTVIEGGGFLIVWASGTGQSEQGSLHTNFSLSSQMETVVLTAPDGKTVVDFINYKDMPAGASYGRKQDTDSVKAVFRTPSPGSTNSGGSYYAAAAETPVFSHKGGFYTGEFDLKLSVTDPGTVIRFTLDGSEPDETSGIYSEPIRIKDRTDDENLYTHIQTAIPYWQLSSEKTFKGTVVRARAYKNGMPASETVTNTYFIDDSGTDRYKLPVISLATDESNLFDEEIGIYVPGNIYKSWKLNNPNTLPLGNAEANFNQTGADWERPVHIEYFDGSGQLALSQDAGVRIHGGWSSAQAQKSLRLYARSQYDADSPSFNFEIFPGLKGLGTGLPLTEFKHLVLRNSGNDWNSTMLRDSLMQNLVSGMDVGQQGSIPAIVFINGEYWGIHYVMQRPDRQFLSDNYGGSPDDFVILEGNGVLTEGEPGDELAFDDMKAFIRNSDMSLDENIRQLDTLMDIDSYLDYVISNTYFNNTDWPQNNVRLWRYKSETASRPSGEDGSYGLDGRWRWILFDTDYGFGLKNDSSFNMVDWILSSKNPDSGKSWPSQIILALMENEHVRQDFLNRFADLLNSSFRTETVIEKINGMCAAIEPYIAEHSARWNTLGGSVDNWLKNTDTLREFARSRPGHIMQQLMDEFGIKGMSSITIRNENPEHGTVKVNTISIKDGTPGVDDPADWTGIYFDGIPVVLQAIPEKGYKFAGWSGTGIDSATGEDSRNSRLTLTLNGDVQIIAEFSPTSEAMMMSAFLYILLILVCCTALYAILKLISPKLFEKFSRGTI